MSFIRSKPGPATHIVQGYSFRTHDGQQLRIPQRVTCLCTGLGNSRKFCMLPGLLSQYTCFQNNQRSVSSIRTKIPVIIHSYHIYIFHKLTVFDLGYLYVCRFDAELARTDRQSNDVNKESGECNASGYVEFIAEVPGFLIKFNILIIFIFFD